MADCRDFLLRCLRDKHPVLGAIVAFHRQYPAHCAESGISPDAAPALPFFARDAQGSSRLLKRAPLLWASPSEPSSSWWALDFRVPRHRLALLEPAALERLALWCGLVAHRQEAARLIDRQAVLDLRALVGEDGHRFVLRRAALLPGAAAASSLSDEETSLPERIRKSGGALIAACLADAPRPIPELLRRVAPPEVAACLAQEAGITDDAHDRHWPLVRTLLFKEIAPAWEPCFS